MSWSTWQRVEGEGFDFAGTYTRIVRDTGTPAAEPGIVVGSQLQLPSDGKTYTLYYLFPLEEEEDTLGLVTRAVLTAAFVMILLVGGITWLASNLAMLRDFSSQRTRSRVWLIDPSKPNGGTPRPLRTVTVVASSTGSTGARSWTGPAR